MSEDQLGEPRVPPPPSPAPPPVRGLPPSPAVKAMKAAVRRDRAVAQFFESLSELVGLAGDYLRVEIDQARADRDARTARRGERIT